MTADRVTINPIAVMDSPADQKPRRTKITPADRGSSPALAKTFTLITRAMTSLGVLSWRRVRCVVMSIPPQRPQSGRKINVSHKEVDRPINIRPGPKQFSANNK